MTTPSTDVASPSPPLPSRPEVNADSDADGSCGCGTTDPVTKASAWEQMASSIVDAEGNHSGGGDGRTNSSSIRVGPAETLDLRIFCGTWNVSGLNQGFVICVSFFIQAIRGNVLGLDYMMTAIFSATKRIDRKNRNNSTMVCVFPEAANLRARYLQLHCMFPKAIQEGMMMFRNNLGNVEQLCDTSVSPKYSRVSYVSRLDVGIYLSVCFALVFGIMLIDGRVAWTR